MLECQVGMQSDTQARKAQTILQRYGYPCRIFCLTVWNAER